MTEGEGEPRAGAVERSISHDLRAGLIRDLWYLGEPASAQRLQETHPEAALAAVNYHLRILEGDGILELAREGTTPGGGTERFMVIAGPNAAEAVRRLGLV